MKELVPPANAKLFESPLSTFWIGSDGILYSVFRNVPRTFERCKERTDLIKSVTRFKPVCSITDITHSGTIDNEAREFLKKEFAKMYKAMAIVTTSPLGKMIATLTTVMAPPSVPTKIFSDPDKARQWLKQYL
jgi:hypothetical protein